MQNKSYRIHQSEQIVPRPLEQKSIRLVHKVRKSSWRGSQKNLAFIFIIVNLMARFVYLEVDSVYL